MRPTQRLQEIRIMRFEEACSSWTEGRLTQEEASAGVTDMAAANRYLREHYRLAFNREFAGKPAVEGSAFVPFIDPGLDDIRCEQCERTVNKDNCVVFEGRKLQIPADRYRHHYAKARVRVHRYPNGSLALFHGPGKPASYTPGGLSFEPIVQALDNVRCQS